MTQFVKMNYMSEIRYMKDLWRCDSCQTSIDNMNHVLCCPSYSELRAGKDLDNDTDMASYLHDVMLIRSRLDIQKRRMKLEDEGPLCPAQARSTCPRL